MSFAGLAAECEVITARATQEICMFLEKCQCVTLEVIRENAPDLFSEELEIECDVFAEFESTSCMFVLPVRDSLTRFARIRKCILAHMASG